MFLKSNVLFTLSSLPSDIRLANTSSLFEGKSSRLIVSVPFCMVVVCRYSVKDLGGYICIIASVLRFSISFIFVSFKVQQNSDIVLIFQIFKLDKYC